jgi:Rieske 2Fe-2S family protein
MTAERPQHRLPPEAYLDPGWHEREQRLLFGRTWAYVAHVHDLPEPGDCVTATVGTEPIVVVRTEAGGLAGFVNICRHRGMTIASGSGACGGTLRCPYHGWEWDLAGTLVRVPQRRTQFPDLDPEALGLHPVAVATWGGFVFAHPDPSAAPAFEGWLGDVPARCGAYPWDDLVEVHRERWPLACNWKLYVENHVDWLHLWYLHDESLSLYDHHGASRWTIGDHWASAERLRAGRDRTGADGLDPIPGLSDDERATLRANLLFPNVPLVTTGTQVNTYQVIPTGPESCVLDLRVFGAGGRLSDAGLADTRRVLVDEDGRTCERMQSALRSRRFAVGPLAVDFERPIADFHAAVLRFVGDVPDPA